MLSRCASRCLPALNGCLVQSRVIVRGAYQVPGNDSTYEQVSLRFSSADRLDGDWLDGDVEGAEGAQDAGYDQGANAGNGDDNVVDADFTEVDDK